MNGIIELQSITKRFEKRNGEPFTAIKDISAVVKPGEFVTIIGPSGCGKTTLLKIIDGLIPSDEGSVFIKGQEVSEPGPERAMVFQDFALMPWATAVQNISFPLEIRGFSKQKARAKAMEHVKLVGLEGFADHYPHELSGGMQQRVGLARALIVEPEILLMDEPFGSVDAQTRRSLQNELLSLWEESAHSTVVFVTHSMDEAVYLSDRILIMSTKPGRIFENLEINIPRPRKESTRKDETYVELTAYIWDILSSFEEDK